MTGESDVGKHILDHFLMFCILPLACRRHSFLGMKQYRQRLLRFNYCLIPISDIVAVSIYFLNIILIYLHNFEIVIIIGEKKNCLVLISRNDRCS